MQTEQRHETIVARLAQLRRRQKSLHLLRGTLIFGVLFFGIWLGALAAEAVFHFSAPVRVGVLVVLGAAFLLAAIALVVWPLAELLFRHKTPDDVVLALRVGDHYDDIRDRLADSLQVYRAGRESENATSAELAAAALEEVYRDVQEHDFAAAADARVVRWWLKHFAVVAGIALLAYAVFPVAMSDAAYRLRHPSRDFSANAGIVLRVAPGDFQAVKGEDVTLTAFVPDGVGIPEVELFLRTSGASDFERETIPAGGENSFSYTIKKIRDETAYFFRHGKRRTDTFTISVVERPFIRNLQANIIFPAYSKLGSQYMDENIGDISALPGSIVKLKLLTNKPVESAALVFDHGTTVPLHIAGQELTGSFVVKRRAIYHISLTDKLQLSNESPIEYRVETMTDQTPFVEIVFPGRDIDLGKDLILPLRIEAQDDYGFTEMQLRFQVLRGGYDALAEQVLALPLPTPGSDQVAVTHNWNLRELGLAPGDMVSYYVRVYDNDRVSGPKSEQSDVFRVRFPSIYEIFDETAATQEETYDELKELQEESKSLKSVLDQVVQQMKRTPALNWEQQQKVRESAAAQEEMRQQLEQVQQKLDDMVNRLEQNDLISQETLEKYRELQQLMQEVMTEELKKALAELQKSLQEMDPERLKQAVEKFSQSQEEFLEGMERTLNLLKKLQIEQKLDEVVKKAQELLRRQEELNKETSSADNAQNSEKYAREQGDIKQDTAELEKELAELAKKMQEFPQMPAEQVEEAKQQAGDDMQQRMQQASRQLQSGQMQDASKSGQQIAEDMQQMVESLQAAKQELTEKQKQKVMQALRRSAHDLLNLSQRQEALMEQTEGTDRNTPGMNELADAQHNLLSGLLRVTNQLYELSQETFAITPETGQALGKSLGEMRGALRQLEARNSRRSTQNQAGAMSALNQAVMQLQASMQSMNSASSAIGFQEMMQRMMGISNQQRSINQQTAQLGQQSGLSAEQQAAMQRLAAEQQALRKSLQQLAQEYRSQESILGDLQKISEDMADVVEDLLARNVDRKTVQRQKEILSRLLDAQKSMHTRDFSEQRRAETGKQVRAQSPRELPDFSQMDAARLKSELLKALREGYSKDYRELIQKYFDALAKEELQEHR